MDPVCTTLHERFNHYLNTESAALCAVPFKELLPSKHVDGMQRSVFAGGIFLDMIYILQHLDHKRHCQPFSNISEMFPTYVAPFICSSIIKHLWMKQFTVCWSGASMPAQTAALVVEKHLEVVILSSMMTLINKLIISIWYVETIAVTLLLYIFLYISIYFCIIAYQNQYALISITL